MPCTAVQGGRDEADAVQQHVGDDVRYEVAPPQI